MKEEVALIIVQEDDLQDVLYKPAEVDGQESDHDEVDSPDLLLEVELIHILVQHAKYSVSDVGEPNYQDDKDHDAVAHEH